ncbi:MAG: hypothetical protein KKH70_03120 [Gammaproteobacteria bacterium]|nr:hypothetical protein [Gammaproteobacteria bacterium]
MKQVLFLLIMLLPTVAVQATGGACNPDHCGGVYVDMLYVNADGRVYVSTSGDEKLLNCQAVSGVYVTLLENSPGRDLIYSTLLTAQSTNRPLTIQVDDNIPGCVIQYVTLAR